MEYFVEKEGSLFSFLEEKGFSKKRTKQYLKNKEVLVNKQVQTDYAFSLKEGDKVTIIKRIQQEICILYEDKDLLVVDKPHHMLTVANAKTKENTLYFKISAYVKQKNKQNKIYIVHRLDFDTAGLLVFAKSEKVKEILQKNWNKTEREYKALVHGKVAKEGNLKFHLRENEAGFVFVSKKSSFTKEAITKYSCQSFKNNISFVHITIETGRKHQIRVSFQEIGHPILGDRKYGVKDSYQHLYLYASSLTLKHPITGVKLHFEKSMPLDFEKLIGKE